MHQRGPDRIPRGTIISLYQAIRDDDGTLEASLRGETSFRARAARAFFRAVDDVENPRVALLAIETLADRVEGRPVQKVEGLVLPQAVFYDASGPIPRGVTPPPPKTAAPVMETFEPAAPR